MWIANHGIFQSQNKVPLLLDLYPNAAVAFSLRKLRFAYSSFAIAVRRSSDNTIQNIGFNNTGGLDESALLSFVGSGNGFITTWYDQSGNGRNLTTANTSLQPRIVNAGVIDKENSKPTAFFNGTSNAMITSNFLSVGISNYSVIAVSRSGGLNTNGRGVLTLRPSTGNVNGYVNFLYRSTLTNNFQAFHSSDGNVANPYSANPLSTYPTTMTLNSVYVTTSHFYYLNGTQQNTTTTVTQANFTSGYIIVGSYFNSALNDYFHSGTISEVIVYLSNQQSNQSGIHSNINSYYTIY